MAGARAGDAAPGSGYTQLILHVNATTTITLLIAQETGGCSLVNSGSSWAALDLGSASKTTSSSACATYASGNTYSLTTKFTVQANCSGTCVKWNLSASLASAAPTGITWHYAGTVMTTTPQTVASGLTYNTKTYSKNLKLSVKTNGSGAAATGAVQQAFDFTATDTSNGTTGTAVLNVEEINEPGISIFFVQDPSGVAMTGGAFNAAVDFTTVSAFGSLPSGVTRPSVTLSNYTVETLFDIDVELGGVTSSSYTLQADTASAAPTGFTYAVNGVSLTTSLQTVESSGTYGTNEPYTLDIIISTAAPGSGGPTVGSALSDTLNFTATAN
jgi:hypothetical protein